MATTEDGERKPLKTVRPRWMALVSAVLAAVGYVAFLRLPGRNVLAERRGVVSRAIAIARSSDFREGLVTRAQLDEALKDYRLRCDDVAALEPTRTLSPACADDVRDIEAGTHFEHRPWSPPAYRTSERA